MEQPRLPRLLTFALLFAAQPVPAQDPVAELGQLIFFDTSLSQPPGQACASCHGAAAGWSGPDSEINAGGAVYEGAVAGRFGNRKPPSVSYATQSPPLHLDPDEDHFVGGTFWDGRATGWLLANPAADQAQMPFLNPVEHNLASPAEVVERVCGGAYGERFRALFGSDVCSSTLNAYNAIGQVLAAFEASPAVNAFSSKYDAYLRDPERYPLSAEERLGLELFEREDKGNCAACHPSRPGPNGEPPLFTDFTYDNLGVPRNPENPWYRMGREINPAGSGWVDAGLGGFLKGVPRFADRAQENLGKYKVPSLRNVDRRPRPDFVKAFMHNGALQSLEAVVHFYNTRDKKPSCAAVAKPQPGRDCWEPPEIAANVNTDELGDLGLTAAEEAAIVAFMKTLSDGWSLPVR